MSSSTPTNARSLTILFTDVVGSTELRSRRGDRLADEILGIHEGIVRGRIAAHGGGEIVFLGDGFMAAFPSTDEALRCAVEIQQALDAHNRGDTDREVNVRIGLHRGEVTERDGTLYGQAVHAASRVASEAAGGEIFVSSVVRDLGAGEWGATFLDRGLFWLKGFPERWRLFEVEWRAGSERPTPGLGPEVTPFVERQDERADLRRLIGAALAGQGSLVLVSGEAGVGKTRLTQEVSSEAEARGMRVLVGHCFEMEGSPPYLPFVEILEQALIDPRSPEALREALGDAASEIARIVPGLRRLMPDLPPPLDLPPEQARRYLWVSLHEFLERAARDRPLLLVLEDLHWADESTLLLLEYLTPHLAEMPMLVAGTYRDVEVGVSHPLARTVNQLKRRRLVERIALRRLTENGVASMLRGLADQDPPRELVRAVFSESEGNAFFTEEVFLHLAETGRLMDEEGRFRTDLEIAEFDVPQSVRLVVGERLARLSESTRDALAAAAASGRTFATNVVSRVAGLGPDGLTDALDEGERTRLVAPAETDAGRMAFTHELIRQTLLADTSSLKRQRLHARTAEAMEEVYADDLEAHAADLAYHLSLAGPSVDASRLVRYLTVAGDRAVDVAAFEDAVAHFQRALSLVSEDDQEARAELQERLAMALRSVGQWDEALRAMDQALEGYEALGRTEALGRLCWAMVYHLGWAARFEEAVLVAGRGLGALGEAPNPDRARLLAAGGWIFGLGGDYQTATEMFQQALDLAGELGDQRALADALHLQTIHHMSYAQLAEGVDTGLRAAAVFEAEGALWDLASVLSFVEFQAGTIVRLEQASDLARRVAPLAGRIGHLGASFMVLSDRIRSEGVMAGDLSRVRELGREQVEVCERGGLPWLYVGHLFLGLAAHWRGDWGEAERELRTAVELEPPAAFAGQSTTLLAILLAHAGRVDDALTVVAERRKELPVSGQVNSLGSWNAMFGLAETLYLTGRRKEAAALSPLLEEALALGEEWITFDCRLIRTRAGIAAAAGRRWDDAEQHFRLALEKAEKLPNRIEEADVRRLHARMLLDRAQPGDRERARDLLEEAIRRYQEIGMPRHVAMSEGLLAESR